MRPTDPADTGCVFLWYAADPIELWQRQISLTLSESLAFPGLIEYKLEVYSQDELAIRWFYNVASSPTSWIADPLDRSQSYSFDAFFWVWVPIPPDRTPPSGTFRIEPLPCIPGWKWGQPIPTWDYEPS